jgi:EmrB/QacA subfamily drug resistance transporter
MQVTEIHSPSITVKRTALLVALLASFLTPFLGSSIGVALPTIGIEFSMSAILLSWVSTAYLLAAAMFLVPFGRVADIHGRKRLLAYGISIMAISSLLCALSNSGIAIIVFRIFQGIGSAMIWGTSMAILLAVYPLGERGKVLGINVASTYLGLSLGPYIGGVLTQQLGWRSIFFISSIYGGLTVLLIVLKLKGEWAEAKGEAFDWIGTIIFSISLISIMYGFSTLPDISGFWLLIGGSVTLTIFVWWELRVDNPILTMSLFFNNRVFAFSGLAALINYGATFAIAFLLSLYLQYIRGYNPQDAGLILVIRSVFMASFSPIAGRLSDRVEPRIVASAGMSLITIGLFYLGFLGEDTPVLLIVLDQVLLGVGFGLFSSPNTNAMMSSVEKKFLGVASATVGTMRLIGQMLSMGIATLSIALIVGPVEITPEVFKPFLNSVNVSFLIFSGLCLIGIFASLARGKVR